MVSSVKHLDVEQIIALHDDQIERYGGASGGGHRGSAYEGVEAAAQAVRNAWLAAKL